MLFSRILILALLVFSSVNAGEKVPCHGLERIGGAPHHQRVPPEKISKNLEALRGRFKKMSISYHERIEAHAAGQYYLQLTTRPEFGEVLSDLEDLYSRKDIAAAVRVQLSTRLIELSPVLRAINFSLSRQILFDFIRSFSKSVDAEIWQGRERFGQRSNRPIEQTSFTQNKLQRFLEKSSSEIYSDTHRRVKARINAMEKSTREKFLRLDSDVIATVEQVIAIFDNERIFQIVEVLVGVDWFLTAAPENQSRFISLLNYLAYMAENAMLDIQKAILTNSLDYILEGRAQIQFADLGKSVAGRAISDEYLIRIHSETKIESPLLPGNTFRYAALAVIPHEVVHLLSAQPVEETIAYFREEMRAWYIGFLAYYGRYPSERDAALHAIFLINSDIDAYEFIGRHFRSQPERFTLSFSEIGLDARIIHGRDLSDPNQLVGEASDRKTAPLWGVHRIDYLLRR